MGFRYRSRRFGIAQQTQTHMYTYQIHVPGWEGGRHEFPRLRADHARGRCRMRVALALKSSSAMGQLLIGKLERLGAACKSSCLYSLRSRGLELSSAHSSLVVMWLCVARGGTCRTVGKVELGPCKRSLVHRSGKSVLAEIMYLTRDCISSQDRASALPSRVSSLRPHP